MNKTKYLQTDSRWGGLGYPKKPWYIRNCGCGEVSVCNVIIEMAQYANYTPATIQPYCKQYAAPNGDGTYLSGIPKMMEHYGLTEVKEHATMDKLWKELAKGNRVAVYLMGKRPGGSKKVHWTSGGHIVCSVAYKTENGKHLVYVKDSYSNSLLRNGWISYEENMRNDVVNVWSGKLNSKTPAPAIKSRQQMAADFAVKIANDNSYHYVKWKGDNKKTQKCCICHGYTGSYKGFNCIRFAFTCWYHGGGIPVAHEGGLIHNALGDKMYKASIKDATKMAQKALNCKDIQVIRNKNGIPQKQLKVGDACMVFSKGKYAHMTLYIGNGKIAHAQGSSGNVPKNKQIEVRKAYKCQMAIRYIGK